MQEEKQCYFDFSRIPVTESMLLDAGWVKKDGKWISPSPLIIEEEMRKITQSDGDTDE